MERFADGLLITGETRHRLLHFTFDDGPALDRTPRMLDTLDALSIRATFFVLGMNFQGSHPRMTARADILREIARRGHTIAVHGFEHVELPSLSPEALRAQLDRAEQTFRAALGYVPRLYRPAHGTRSPRVDAELAARGFTTVIWNQNPTDYVLHDAAAVRDAFARVLAVREARDGTRGGVVLMHDTEPFATEEIRLVVEYVQRRNCELLTHEGEELYDIVDDMTFFYVPRGDAPPGTHAPPAEPPAAVLAERQRAVRERATSLCRSLTPTLPPDVRGVPAHVRRPR